MPLKSVLPDSAAFIAASSRLVVRRPIAAAVGGTCVISLYFLIFSGQDIGMSRLFYVPGIGFPAGGTGSLKLLRSVGLLSINLSIIIVALLTLLRCLPFGAWLPLRLKPPRVFLRIRPSALIFLTATAALGPGLIVNVLLKDHWGRARPVGTTMFGGDQSFSLPWVISDACHRNCSFVSGEGSAAFWLLAFAFVVPRYLARPVAIMTFLWAAVLSLNRIAFGGHYLSDVLIGWGVMLVVLLICRDFVLIRWGEAIDRSIVRFSGGASARSPA